MENLDESNNKNVSLSLIAEYGASDSDSDDTETRSNTGNEDSDAAEISEMVLKNNIINACAHGPIARSSVRDDDDDQGTRHMIIDSLDSGVVEYEVTEYRDDSDSDSSSDCSDSDVDSVKDIEEISSGDEDTAGRSGKVEIPKVHGELELDDLPPIEDLAISLPSQETTKIGTITSIVDRLVIVRAFPETPAVDLDSVLFLDNGAKTLGKVFDVFGPVTEPHYCVRFNSAEHVAARGVRVGADAYIAPRTAHTSYVFLSELMKVKGSDASWLHDVEPPPSQIEYSDDEEERRANRERKEQRQRQREDTGGETSINKRNPEPRRNQRPSESSSRFGSGPSRGRNPFSASSRRNNLNMYPRYSRPWPNMDMRTPPPHPDPGAPFTAPPFTGPPMFPPPFNPTTPPFMGNPFQFGGNPRMPGNYMGMPPFRHSVPVFGANFCGSGPQPQWVNNGPPPPPGT
ncbi:H/ACA ribonucleoprotein complex non-core subunit NAF1 [Plodia interpunctella]|uniref:H/ACA ribonucleoprotein complex non-core subunit NAF1 n=1 Tax=Plodia interpunctella TaxID=58824 RepID=UPI002367A784|nr:H/ACA ribonucleoprotein complex non-core subunit NAF1 [Plodia interpunctella]